MFFILNKKIQLTVPVTVPFKKIGYIKADVFS